MRQKIHIVSGARCGVALAVALLLATAVMPAASAATATTGPSVTTPTLGAADTAPAGPLNISVSPPSSALEAVPGSTATADIRVQNQGPSTERISIGLKKFTADGDSGLPRLADVQPGDESANWVTFSSKEFSVDPTQSQTVRVTIAPPKTAAFGYYYAVVFSRANASTTIKKQTNNLLSSIATLLLVDVKAPGAVRQLQIAQFSTNSRTAEFLPAKFSVRLKNIGNTHVASRGTITIYRDAKALATLDVNAQGGYILPGTYRTFDASWADGTPSYKDIRDGKNNPVIDKNGNRSNHLDWNNFSLSKLRFGKYNARAVIIYNDGKGQVSSVANLSFWIIPWRIIGAILAIVLFGCAGLYALIIRPIRSRVKKARGRTGHDSPRQS